LQSPRQVRLVIPLTELLGQPADPPAALRRFYVLHMETRCVY
jgi:hypothetical protein